MFSFSLLKYGILFAHNITISSSMLFILFLNGQYFHYFSISEGTIFPSHNSILHTSLLALEKAMTPHSSTLTWKIPLTEEPGRLHTWGARSWTWLKQLWTPMFICYRVFQGSTLKYCNSLYPNHNLLHRTSLFQALLKVGSLRCHMEIGLEHYSH